MNSEHANESQKRFSTQNEKVLSEFAISASFRDMDLIRSALEWFLTVAQLKIKKVNQKRKKWSKKVVQNLRNVNFQLKTPQNR